MLGSQSYWNSVVSLYLTPGKQAIRAVVVGRSELDLLNHRLSHELLVELRGDRTSAKALDRSPCRFSASVLSEPPRCLFLATPLPVGMGATACTG